MSRQVVLSDDECSFLSYWTWEFSCPFVGPASLWCLSNRVCGVAPFALARIFTEQEIEAGREGWFWERPPAPFRAPWKGHEGFWERTFAACSEFGLDGVGPSYLSSPIWKPNGTLTTEESSYLRAYFQQMALSGSGHYIDLAHQHGVLGLHMAPFFILLDGLDRPPEPPIIYPWPDFPARYEELSGRKYNYPDYALSAR